MASVGLRVASGCMARRLIVVAEEEAGRSHGKGRSQCALSDKLSTFYFHLVTPPSH